MLKIHQHGNTALLGFRLRFNNHKSWIRVRARLSFDNKSRDGLIYRHFHGPAHNGIKDLDIQLTDQVDNERDLLDRKDKELTDLTMYNVKPHELNESDSFQPV